MNRFIALGLTGALVFPFAFARAGIIGHSGSVEIVSPPADVRTARLESDIRMVAFAERQGVSLTSPLWLDIHLLGTSPSSDGPNLSPLMLPIGTLVNSYFVHFDAIGEPANGNTVFAEGSISVDQDILGVVLLSDTLNASHAVLGAEATLYPVGEHQGIELNTAGAYFTLGPDRRTVSFGMPVGPYADNLRIVTTTVPEASSAILLTLGASSLALLHRAVKIRQRG